MLTFIRKNSKIVLAIVGVILMLSWLVVPAIQSIWDANGNSQGGDSVKVTWRGGRLTEKELQHLRMVHGSAVRFISLIIQETAQRQGTSKAPGYMFLNPQQDPDRSMIGISPHMDDGHLVQTLILAQQARELGVTVNDETVKTFLEVLGDYTLKEGDLADLLQRALPEGSSTVKQGTLFEHLKDELLAQQMRIMMQAGVESFTPGEITPLGSRPMRLLFRDHGLSPPGEMWAAYEKLNRRVQIEAFPLHASDYVSKVTEKPTDAQLKELFEEGRTRLPNPEVPYPGFMQPHKVAFEYVKVELKPFLDAAKKEITDEQVAKAYEEGKAKGDFKVVEPPPVDPTVKPEVKPEVKPGDKPVDPDAPKDPADAPKPGDKPATDKPADKPASDEPKTEKPAEKTADKPGEKKPEPPAAPETKKPDPDKADKADPDKVEPKKNEGSALGRDIHLVNFQEDDKKKTEDKPDNEKPAETKPADPTAKPAETKPADPAAKPAEVKPEEPKEVKFKPLSEVEDDIRTQLARPIASERRQAFVTKAIAAVNAYSRDFNRWKAYADREKELKTSGAPAVKERKFDKPAPLDLAKVVEDPTLKVNVIPLVDEYEVQAEVDKAQADGTTKKEPKYEIGVRGFRFEDNGLRPFPQVAFNERESFYLAETMPFPWENKQFMGGGGADIWIYWRTDEQVAKEVTFEAAKENVIAQWKLNQALKLAQEEAAKLAEQASKGKELKSLVAKPEEIVSPPAFTWFTSGALTGQFGRPSPSQIEGIKYAGQDFRQGVFDLKVGQAGAALDQPHSTVWLVRLVSEEGVSDLDRARFMEKATDPELVDAAWQSQIPLQAELYSEMFKRFNVSWAPDTDDEE